MLKQVARAALGTRFMHLEATTEGFLDINRHIPLIFAYTQEERFAIK